MIVSESSLRPYNIGVSMDIREKEDDIKAIKVRVTRWMSEETSRQQIKKGRVEHD